MARSLIRHTYSLPRSLAIILVGLALALSVAWAVVQPLRPILAARYLDRGDALLESQEFAAAIQEYRLALTYEPSSEQAKSRLALARTGHTDPAVLADFYRQHGVDGELSKLERATGDFSSPKQALTVGVSLYSSRDYGYARYALEKAVELDPQYAEAWNYLALDDKELARLDPTYVAKQAEAEAKRDTLTAKYLSR